MTNLLAAVCDWTAASKRSFCALHKTLERVRRFTLKTSRSSSRQGSAALEFALVFPVYLLFVFGLIAAYSLISARRAMDVGIERALRYAAVHGGSGTTPVVNAYNTAAQSIWTNVGSTSTVSVTPSTFKAGDTVTITVTYPWVAPAGLNSPDNNIIFNPVTLSASGSMRVNN